MIIDNIPGRTSADEIKEYFTTLIVYRDSSLTNTTIIKNIEFSDEKKFCVLTMTSKKAREILKSII